MKEIWKDVVGYEGYYQVSNLGNVKSLNYSRTEKEKILKYTKSNCGYLRIELNVKGKRKIFSIHRLVAQAFISNPENLPCVNHKDENRSNNCVDNLEWCSHKYNSNYGTIKEKLSKALGKRVLCIETNAIFVSTGEAGRKMNINQAHISDCANGKRNVAGGYHWEYII